MFSHVLLKQFHFSVDAPRQCINIEMILFEVCVFLGLMFQPDAHSMMSTQTQLWVYLVPAQKLSARQ